MLNNFNMRAFRGTQGFKIIGHENSDNNLESLCILVFFLVLNITHSKTILVNSRIWASKLIN